MESGARVEAGRAASRWKPRRRPREPTDIGAAEEEEVIEDTSELGEDDEDVAEVIEGGVDDEKDR